jgi:aminoglycoside phosphotransferase (APT) family kinase protein
MSDPDHLRSFHDRWNTPWHLVLGALREVTHAPVVSLKRIVQGAANEVYDVGFDNAEPLIVRIARDAAKNMEPERWVIGQCARAGMLVPHIHFIRHTEWAGMPLHICIMQKLEGERLCDASLDEREMHRVLNQLGAWLSHLHAIDVSGFGYLDGEGRAPFPDYSGAGDEFATVRADFSKAADVGGLALGRLNGWLGEMNAVLQVVRPMPVLAHNDLLAKHVLVQDGRLSGVIDFGEVSGEPALNEFAKWDFVEGDRFPVRHIAETYADSSLFAAGYEPFYRTLWLMNGLYLMRWQHQTGHARGVRETVARLLAGEAEAARGLFL